MTPVSGKNGIQITIPKSAFCFWSAFTQAEYTLHVKIVDGSGNTLVDESGTGTDFRLMGFGQFPSPQQGSFTVYITANNNQDVSVLWQETTLNTNNTDYVTSFLFTGEDHGAPNDDYNDITLNIICFKYDY